MTGTVRAVDLFCGAGGLSTGLALACEELDRDVELVAVNHWTKAIETHRQNHPWAEHRHAKVEELRPADVFEPGTVDILVGGPECTHFSTARGGKPVDEQKRASPYHVLDWVGKLRPESVLVENVREFAKWGPIDEDGQPTRNGEIFEAWLQQFRAHGYSVDWQVLNAADYGDATTRERLFVVGRRNYVPEFPAPTHAEEPTPEDDREPWRPAAEVIDWSAPGESIWTRSRPLVNNTMQRIAEGIRRHAAPWLEPFADTIARLGKEDVEALQARVVPASQAAVVAAAVDEPFLVRPETSEDSRAPTALAHPQIVKYHGTGANMAPSKSLDEPLDTITAGGRNYAFVRSEPYLLGQHGGAVARSALEEPVPTIATDGYIRLFDAAPFVLPRNGPYRGLHSNPAYDPGGRPLHTVTAKNHDGHVVSPFLMRFSHGGALLDVDDPVPTITTARGGVFGVTQAYLVQYHGNSGAQSLAEPTPTLTTKDSLALVVPDLYPWGLDVRFRMLQPRELAAAMGFPEAYEFAGTKTETTEQIGNAVPVNLAQALCRELLVPTDDPTLAYYEDPQEAVADGGGGRGAE